MRRLFTMQELFERGVTKEALRWGEGHDRWRQLERGVYAEGPEEPSPLDRARASVIASRGVASERLAGVLYGLDGVELGASGSP